MSTMIAVQLEPLFDDVAQPGRAHQFSPCFLVAGHRIISIEKASKDGPASMLIGTGLKMRVDGGNEIKLYSVRELAKFGIRLASWVEILDPADESEVTIQLVRDFNDKAAVQEWDKLVDQINNKKHPAIVQAQPGQVFVPLFAMKQDEQQQQQQPQAGDDLPPDMPEDVRAKAKEALASAESLKPTA